MMKYLGEEDNIQLWSEFLNRQQNKFDKEIKMLLDIITKNLKTHK